MNWFRRPPTELPAHAPVWRATYDCALPAATKVRPRARTIRRGQVVREPEIVAAFPADHFTIAGYRHRSKIRLTDDGPEWLWTR